jgi:hypothetical protein
MKIVSIALLSLMFPVLAAHAWADVIKEAKGADRLVPRSR